jgi:hypothetical protein
MTAEQVKAFREYYKCYRWIMDKKGPTLWLAAVRLWGRKA